MKRKIWCLVLAAVCLLGLWGCERATPVIATEPVATEEIVLATVPEDGNPDDVTCKGTYTAVPEEINQGAVIATVGDGKLTNEQLAVWYHAAIAQYRQEEHEEAPDFEGDLNMQVCGIDDSVNSWQQYFLREALDSWHMAQALEVASRTDLIEKEPEYAPVEGELEQYMTGMPATEVLYGYHDYYKPNSMHQAYLDGTAERLEAMAQEKGYSSAKEMAERAFGADADALEEMVTLYNYGYMYFTQLGYGITTEEAAEKTPQASEESYVDIRQILLVPDAVVDRKGNVQDPVTVAEDGTVTCSEELWEKCRKQADKLLREWKSKYKESEKGFRELAYQNSEDAGSFENGGIYRQLRKGQLVDALDEWCFAAERQAGDTTVIRTEYGIHILYFAGSRSAEAVRQQTEKEMQLRRERIEALKKRFPAKVSYEKIQLPQADGTVSYDDILYPDVAHERYPELPLYLQQAYGDFKFGWDRLYTHGCGITSFALLSSYMMDEEYTPPEMSEQFRRYNSAGTDGMLFINEPSTMGFYLKERTYDPKLVEQALREGHKVIALMGPGYWTTTGHYITLEAITEDEKIQVRDTHIFNYGKLPAHKEDKHELKAVFSYGVGGYWVMSKKVTTTPFCCRCGDGSMSIVQTEDYICEKCEKALVRRNVWLES